MSDRIQEAAEVLAKHQHEDGVHREAYCDCGAPIGEYGGDLLRHQAQALADAGLLRDDTEPTGPFHWRIPHGRLSEQGYPTYEEAMDAAARAGFLTIASVVKMPTAVTP